MSEESSPEKLNRIVKETLRTKGDGPKLTELAREAAWLSSIESKARELARDGRPITDVDRGQAWWALIKEAIQRLKPADARGMEPDPHRREWHSYIILTELYVKGRTHKETARLLGISVREMERRLVEARERLAAILSQ